MTPNHARKVRVTVPLSMTKPPLSLNTYTHHMQRARIVRQLREEVVTRLRMLKVRKPADHVAVRFHYRPRDNRVRDPMNLVATSKPLVDALTPGRPAKIGRNGKITQPVPGYGLVPDDNPEFVDDQRPVIHRPDKTKGPACWLELTITYKETP